MFFAGAAAVALAINLLFAALIHLAPAGAVAGWIDNWGITLLAGCIAVPATLAGRNNRGRRRWAWWLIGLAGASWSVGNILYSVNPNANSPSLDDVLYLAAVPLAATGLVMIGSQRATRGGVIRLVLDGLTVVPATVFISWALVLRTIWLADTNPANGYSVAATVTYLAYPVTDILLVAFALFVFARQTGRLRLSIGLIAAGYLGLAIADSGFNYYSSVGVYLTNTVFWTEMGYSVGFSLVALGLLDAWLGSARATRKVPGARRPPDLGLLTYIPVAGAALIAIRQELVHAAGDAVLFWSGLLVLALVLARQLLALRENDSLRRRLERRVADVLQERRNLRTSEERFRSLIENSSDVIVILDPDLTVLWVSDSLARVIGQTPAMIVGSSVAALIHDDDREQTMLAFRSGLANGSRPSALECRVRGSQGEVHSVDIHVTNLIEDPAVGGVVLNIRDVTERRELENQLLHQALHDPLTHLPNRVLLLDRLEHEMRRKRGRDHQGPSVLFLDLDGFKTINDSMGHQAGDLLLRQVGERLLRLMRPGDTVARIGGDEFAVIVINSADAGQVGRIATRLIDAIATPFAVDGQEVYVTASVGISMSVTRGEPAGALLQQADLAMYRAKELGRNRAEVFVPSLQSAVQQRLDTEGALRSALAGDEFRLHYQPILDLSTRRMVATEALIRWLRPDGTLVSPLDFIPLAERSGLIVPIGRWVLRAACAQARRWQLELPECESLSVSVNLSARQLREPDLAVDVMSALADSGLAASSLILEVTESVLVDDIVKTSISLAELRRHGVRIAVDDFGTGYSSLSYLRTLPLDIIKIDRSFVTAIAADPATLAVARSIVALADALGLSVTAEGIETATELDELVRLGCGFGQGFHLAGPVPATEIARVATELRARATATGHAVTAA